ncbi:hypothetical protein BaRGS_00026108 [Batillaria attramentaria]|uniref:Uncharacterized protein n=1 Tax=Batillaria attramentaria TaxID=370345 RepID=A0ABD0J6Y5_9CAEN
MWTTEDTDPLKWRFYHATHRPDRATLDAEEAQTAAAFDPGYNDSLQVSHYTSLLLHACTDTEQMPVSYTHKLMGYFTGKNPFMCNVFE